MIERVTLFEITWNNYNGLWIDLFHIDKGYVFSRSLFSINTDFKRFLILNVFFVEVTVWDKTP